MKINLSVGDRFPLSWKCEDEKDERGRQTKARTVGRRVWGKDIAVAQWALESDAGQLLLIDLVGMRVHQRFSPPEGYDSPWHSECVARAIQVAEWHEAQAFNSVIDLCSIVRDPVSLQLRDLASR